MCGGGYTEVMRIVLSMLLALALWLAGAPGWAAPWVTRQVPGALLHVRPGQQALARRLAGLTATELPRVAGALGLTEVASIPLYAYASRADFLRDTGLQPDLLGESWYPEGDILLDASGSDSDIRRVLAHELAHSLLAQRLGDQVTAVPRWVNEGIAGHLSDPVSPDEMDGIARLIHRDGVLALDELEAAFPGGPHRDAAYLQSRSMVSWLEYEHPGALRRLCDAMAARQPFAAALDRAAGVTPARWLADWQHSVPPIMFWLAILSSPVVYSPLALILAWLALRRLLRKEEPPEDEEEDDETDDDASEDTSPEKPGETSP